LPFALLLRDQTSHDVDALDIAQRDRCRTLWATPEPLDGVAGVAHGVRDRSTPQAVALTAWLLSMESVSVVSVGGHCSFTWRSRWPQRSGARSSNSSNRRRDRTGCAGACSIGRAIAAERLLPGTSRAIGKHPSDLRSRRRACSRVDAKRNSELIAIRGWGADGAERTGIGRNRGSSPARCGYPECRQRDHRCPNFRPTTGAVQRPMPKGRVLVLVEGESRASRRQPLT
jgi:hypothetical protein